jgi:hypothetical protein
VKGSSLRLPALLAAAAVGALALAAPGLADPGGNGKGKAKGNPHLHLQSPSASTAPSVTSPVASASVQGVVQAVWSTGALVRLLDGRTVNISLGRDTVVVVDGHPSRLAAVKPGYVLLGIMRSGNATVLRFVKPG